MIHRYSSAIWPPTQYASTQPPLERPINHIRYHRWNGVLLEHMTASPKAASTPQFSWRCLVPKLITFRGRFVLAYVTCLLYFQIWTHKFMRTMLVLNSAFIRYCYLVTSSSRWTSQSNTLPLSPIEHPCMQFKLPGYMEEQEFLDFFCVSLICRKSQAKCFRCRASE